MILGGMQVIVSPYVPEKTREEVQLAWWERLFSWPWRPWIKTRIKEEDAFFIIENRIVVHPAIFEKIKKGEALFMYDLVS